MKIYKPQEDDTIEVIAKKIIKKANEEQQTVKTTFKDIDLVVGPGAKTSQGNIKTIKLAFTRREKALKGGTADKAQWEQPISLAQQAPIWANVIVTLLNGVGLLSILPWFGLAMMSFMALDAPDAASRSDVWLWVGGIWSYPLWGVVLPSVGSRTLMGYGKPVFAVLVASIVLLPVAWFFMLQYGMLG